MASKTEHSESTSTLPAPELNPLINPVLGQNMGRWAEVYFTSPPEKREQAVLELLRELQGENANPEVSAATPLQARKAAPEPLLEAASEASATSSPLIRCSVCGRANPASHKFCGMCGASTPGHEVKTEFHDAGSALPVESTPPADEDKLDATREQEEAYEPALNTNELSLFQSGRHSSDESGDDDLFSYSTPSRPYRAYVGIALALTIVALAYMAWRSTQAASQSHLEPQAPPAVTTQPVEPAAAPAQPAPSSTAAADGTQPADQPAPSTTKANENETERKNTKNTVAKSPAREGASLSAPATAPTEKAPAESAASNGAEELATALRYLNGTNGEQRNASEAAKWLWKSLAKHNATATLDLADLYLKGDGVSKNCDQARILLRSAARAGMKQAGERLRHLQAFGCE